MKKINLFQLTHITVAILLFSTLGIAQESLYRVPLSQQIQESSYIIEGKVLSKVSFWDENHQNIYTSNTIQVFKVFKGQPKETIEVITKGGIVDFNAEIVSNSLKLQIGDLGILFLSSNNLVSNFKSNDAEYYYSVSANQGFYKYNLEADFALNPISKISGIIDNLYNKITKSSKQIVIKLSDFDVVKSIDDSMHKTESRIGNPAPSIASLSASDNSAGTKSVLTINGSNLGVNQGSVGFRDANFGGAIFTNALDSQVLNWSDNQIEVEIPGHAGTGNIRVNTNSNGSITSLDEVNIDYAQTNLEYDFGSGEVAYQTQHIDNNTNGGNTWQMNVDFSNSSAEIPFKNAFDTWTCQSGINWDIDINTTTNTVIVDDNQNLITFNSLPTGLLAQCTSRYSGCAVDGEIRWYVKEIDIVFNSNINWNYNSSSPSSGEIDFETVAVHELGHGQQLGHVIDNNFIMHYALSGGDAQRQLSPEDLMGAQDIMLRSTSTTICNQPLMTFSSCFNNLLSANEFQLSKQITVFPNPASHKVTIKSNDLITVKNISIYNVEGKRVFNTRVNLDSQTDIIIGSFNPGIYFVQLITNSGAYTKKLLIK